MHSLCSRCTAAVKYFSIVAVKEPVRNVRMWGGPRFSPIEMFLFASLKSTSDAQEFLQLRTCPVSVARVGKYGHIN